MADAYAAVDEPAELALIARPLDEAGERREVFLAIDGMHCAACTVALTTALAPLTESVEVNVVARRARLVWRPARAALSEILRTIARLDYAPRPVPLDALDHVDLAARRSALWRLLVGLLCMMQVMMFAVPRYLAGDALPPDLRSLMIWAELMLTVPVLAFAAGPFFTGAWADWRHRRIGMDTPVALGIAVTIATSLVALDRGEDVYFDSVTMFVTLLLIARWLESAARARAAAGLAGSLARLPETADRLRGDGSIETVSRRVVEPGDRLRVAAGATIPTDGVVAAGTTRVDESLLTGESRPLARTVGDPVVAGSLNQANPIEVLATRRVVESRLAELQRLIERAGAVKPAVLRRADRLAGPLLAAVLVIAALTWLGWLWVDPARAPWAAAAVLIVTCPCALALAAPSALLAAIGNLARRGVAIGATDTLEALARADLAVFDKTGTLTTAIPQVQLLGSHGISAADALALAAAIEQRVLHPVARAFEQAGAGCDATGALPASHAAAAAAAAPAAEAAAIGGRPASIAVRDVAALPSGGVRATVEYDGVPRSARLEPRGERLLLELFESDRPAAAISASAEFELIETLRADARSVVTDLAREGLAVRIASGDHPARVARVAAALGVPATRVQAGARPEDKLAWVAQAQRDGHRVLMIGDGINDAPVLGAADVSVSFAGAAPLARHHADVLLLGDRLDALVAARRIARRALAIVDQNLALSIGYNVIAIPLAVAGALNPWQAGLGMAASSLVVVANALRAGR
ncbi:MAG: heavy metal translocating P-type ATPase [Lautropia sp.]